MWCLAVSGGVLGKNPAGGQGVAGSNPAIPTNFRKHLRPAAWQAVLLWAQYGHKRTALGRGESHVSQKNANQSDHASHG